MKYRLPLTTGMTALATALTLSANAQAQAVPESQMNNLWFTQAQSLQAQ